MSALTSDTAEDLANIAKGMLVTCTPNGSGDKRSLWDPKSKEDVKLAQAEFDAAKAQGMTAFAVKKSGDAGKVLADFDPQAGKIIYAPKMVGG